MSFLFSNDFGGGWIGQPVSVASKPHILRIHEGNRPVATITFRRNHVIWIIQSFLSLTAGETTKMIGPCRTAGKKSDEKNAVHIEITSSLQGIMYILRYYTCYEEVLPCPQLLGSLPNTS